MAVETKSLVDKIESLGAAASAEIERCTDASSLERLRIRYLGKKSALSALRGQVKEVATEERPKVGQAGNRVKTSIDEAISARKRSFESAERARRLEAEALDVTLPGRPMPAGHLHPVTLMFDEIEAIFGSMGFDVALGPDLEEEFYNFDALNMPADHPARDMHDTFYLRGGGLLRTHTSPVQIRSMRAHPPPLAIIAPGKVYRCDSADATHSPVFHQVEGFLIDRGVRFSDLKGILNEFLRRVLAPDVQTRFRPSYFPFTEPSAEVDILWKTDSGEPEWLEVLGSGMIHRNVLKAGGYDPDEVSGFAFGLGVDRFAMLKYGVPDLRLFFDNDLRFLRQF